ncbi:DUF1801 domain-containing protein [Sphingomonas sp. TDK1]|uniref:DUF1801 domain-containing protein n=1 Tax=Sphingomonas sp. TDK1 TaxID=453247 RepID=UPI0018DB31CB|nr:DUF1801 domain-containing protein [Sphingomonas sp. TDK1]
MQFRGRRSPEILLGREHSHRYRTPTEEIDAQIAALSGWRGTLLAKVRRLIHEALPGAQEEVKWRKPSNPGACPSGRMAASSARARFYKDKAKLTFARGAVLPDPAGLFNASLDAGTHRAIDLRQSNAINEAAFRTPIRAAADENHRA